MKLQKRFYSQSKDQAMPFALPALRTYKQNLLFPDGYGKDGLIDRLEDIQDLYKTQTRNIRKIKPKKSLDNRISPIRPINNNLRQILVGKTSSNPTPNLSKGPLGEQCKRNQRVSQQSPARSERQPDGFLKKEKNLRNIKEFIRKKIRDTNKDSKRRNFSGDNKEPKINLERALDQQIAERIPLKKISPSAKIKEHVGTKDMPSKRSNSLSDQSLNPLISPTTARVSSFSKGPRTNRVRFSVTRSVSRKRHKVSRKSADNKFANFEMSDLSICPFFS